MVLCGWLLRGGSGVTVFEPTGELREVIQPLLHCWSSVLEAKTSKIYIVSGSDGLEGDSRRGVQDKNHCFGFACATAKSICRMGLIDHWTLSPRSSRNSILKSLDWYLEPSSKALSLYCDLDKFLRHFNRHTG